jgi:acyl-coenzyme A synthetase/AMP-(fatty) acid ligase
MLPSRWLRLGVLPKNANGKIDRRRVLELFREHQEQPVEPVATARPQRA